MTSHDVVVVGAGLAGLAASIRLRDKGHEPLLLERSDGPGGRVRTDLVDGFRLDRGFQSLLTAYPAAQDLLDYDALDLQTFDAGALVRIRDDFHRVSDPFRCPGDAFGSLRAPVGSLKDKRAILKFRKRVCAAEIDDLFTEKETTAVERLRSLGFSDTMIDSFLRPLFAGIALDPELEFSSRSLEFIFRMLTEGDAAVPAEGMGAIAEQLAARLPDDAVRYDATVTGVGTTHVDTTDGRVEALAVVIATDAADASRLTGGEVEDPGSHALTTWWLSAPEPPVQRPIFVLDGNNDSAVNNLAVLSQVSEAYSPDDRALIAVSTPRLGVAEGDVRTTLTDWFGDGVEGWETLRVDSIERAQPRQKLGEDPDQSVRLGSGLFVAGDHRQHPSIHGALVSGCRAADAVTAKLCRTP
ncbi:MAG: oxidoreductase [Acidimicrobiales bacterium]|nr:MAG: oxidoreductase [Acidimicrobiales bacterium]